MEKTTLVGKTSLVIKFALYSRLMFQFSREIEQYIVGNGSLLQNP